MPIPYQKLPAEIRKLTAPYSAAAEIVSGDTLTTATVAVSPAGLTLGSPTVDTSSNQVTFLISDGDAGTTYTVTCLANTTGGADIGAQVQIAVTNSFLG